MHTIYSRLLAFPMATVAAVQGHAFGAGAMLATSHDFRVMRADRGFYCLPEVSLNMPFTVGMSALLNTASAQADRGRGDDDGPPLRRLRRAAARASSTRSADGDGVLAAAVTRAAALDRAPAAPNLAGIKRGIHRDALAALATVTDKSNF